LLEHLGMKKKTKPDGSILNRTFKIAYHSLMAPNKVKVSSSSFFDRAKLLMDKEANYLYENEEVEDVKSFVKIMPILFCFIFYWYQLIDALLSNIFYVLSARIGTKFWCI